MEISKSVLENYNSHFRKKRHAQKQNAKRKARRAQARKEAMENAAMFSEKEQSMNIRSIEVVNDFESNSLDEDVVDHLPDDLVVVDQLDGDA